MQIKIMIYILTQMKMEYIKKFMISANMHAGKKNTHSLLVAILLGSVLWKPI